VQPDGAFIQPVLQKQERHGDRKEKQMVYMAWTASKMVDNDFIWWSSFDGNAWSPQTPFTEGHSSASPTLANLFGVRYMAWKGVNNDFIWWSSFDGNAWSPPELLTDRHSSTSPALAHELRNEVVEELFAE